MTGAPGRHRAFLVFALPLLAGNLLNIVWDGINTLFLGRMIGPRAIAAVASYFPVSILVVSLVLGLGSGSSVLIGQAWGARDTDRVRAVAGAALALALLLGTGAALIGVVAPTAIMRGLQTPPDVLQDAAGNARLALIGTPSFFLFMSICSLLRGVGDTRSPLIALGVATAISVVLAPALIVGFGPLPRLGVLGPATASLVATTGATLWLCAHLLRTGSPIAPTTALLRHLRVERAMAGKLLRLALPTLFQLLSFAAAESVLLALLNHHGSAATAAFGVLHQIVVLLQAPSLSIGIATAILCAQAIGAGRPEELSVLLRTAVTISLCFTTTGIAVVYAASTTLISVFLTDPASATLGRHAVWIVVWGLSLQGLAIVFASVMRGAGTVLPPMLFSLAAICLVELPLATAMNARYGVDGIFTGYPAMYAATCALNGAYYFFAWRKRRVARLV